MKKHVSAFTCLSVLLLLLLVACGSLAQAATSGNPDAAQAGRTPSATVAPTATQVGQTPSATVAPTATRADRTPSATVAPASTSAAGGLPRPAHVVIVMEENRSFGDIIGSSQAPYINSLASQGAFFTNSFAITHPSEPNYLALFSGSTHGLSSDSCPHTFSGANLASELKGAGFSFDGYSEGLPRVGYTGCTKGPYARKHNPWVVLHLSRLSKCCSPSPILL